jgi:FAD/FMN-containing dehydrogenase
VRAIEIVTADGRSRRVTAWSDADLFWALRGGKGNFGVVTALEFALVPLSRLYGGGLFFPGEHAPAVLHTWREWIARLPAEASSSVAFLRLPPLPTVPEPLRDKFVLHVRFSSLGASAAAAQLLAPIREIAPTMLDTITELPYSEASSIFLDPQAPAPWVERSAALKEFSSQAADALLTVVGPDADTGVRFVELRPLGGAMEGPPSVPDAVPGRSARFSLVGSAMGPAEQAPVLREQLSALIDTMAPWAQDEMPPNLLSSQQGVTPEGMRAVYGAERYDRLAAIKQRYDPRNLFRNNHNIQPAQPAADGTAR